MEEAPLSSHFKCSSFKCKINQDQTHSSDDSKFIVLMSPLARLHFNAYVAVDLGQMCTTFEETPHVLQSPVCCNNLQFTWQGKFYFLTI